MPDLSRLAWRLRRRFLFGYELALYALLFAMAVAVALPSQASGADEPLQCGNNQSSPVVMTR